MKSDAEKQSRFKSVEGRGTDLPPKQGLLLRASPRTPGRDPLLDEYTSKTFGSRELPELTPQRGVTGAGEDFFSDSDEPWLRLDNCRAARPGAMVQIRYSSSIFDDPARPMLRFWLKDGGFRDVIAPAPYCGAGVWIGRIPKGFREAWISPAKKAGPFSFRIDGVERVSARLIALKAIEAPKRMFFAASARLVGLQDEADLNLRWALGQSKSEKYRSWRARRVGSIAVKPRSDWSVAPQIILTLNIAGHSEQEVEATYRSMCSQSYSNWRLVIEAGDGDLSLPACLADDRRCATCLPRQFEPQTLWGALQAGDELSLDALACFVEYFARNPQCAVAYADDVIVGADGEERLNAKPDWSPCLEEWAPYIGRAALWRFPACGAKTSLMECSTDAIAHILREAKCENVGHVRRALFRFLSPATPGDAIVSPRIAAAPREGRTTLIIPTRDRSALLKACLDSVLSSDLKDGDDILIVDNGSSEPQTETLFRQLQARRANLAILRQPGPFNFSALCNAAAAQAKGDFLVFLNNDTEVCTPDWIEKLQHFAARMDIGAVGARLVFPQQTVQHQGVVLGLGGVAGHFGAHEPADASGWRNIGRAPHEVSAVTAACLMVERRKFEAVGGFDAENLPIDLNDVDLCLRLAQHRWRTICDPRVQLVHHESASRGGGALRLQRVYARERAYFSKKWRMMIRDDPYFSPALSLYALSECLW